MLPVVVRGVGWRKNFHNHIVCSSSLVPTVICLVGILDKAVTETEALLKLREKRGANLDAKAAAQSSLTSASASVGGALAIREMLEGDDDDDDRSLDATNTQTNSGSSAEAAAAMRARARQALRVVDAKVYQCLHKAFEAAVCLLYRSVADAAEKVIGLFTKLFKLQVGLPMITASILLPDIPNFVSYMFVFFVVHQVRVTKSLVAQKAFSLPPAYRALAEYVANSANPKIEDFILTIHNTEGGKGKTMVKINRQAKVVPDLIFNMEQLDVQLIKLSSIVRLVDKKSVTKLIKRTAARDFKITIPGSRGGGENNPPPQQQQPQQRRERSNAGGAGGGHRKRVREEEE